jgi:glycosyltransferase 2 family protein
MKRQSGETARWRIGAASARAALTPRPHRSLRACRPSADSPSDDGGLRAPRWRHVGRWALTLGLIGLLVSQVDRLELAALFRGASPAWLIVAVALAFGDRVIATVRWWLLLRSRGVLIRFWSLLGVQLTSTFLGGFLPTSFGADAVRITMLVRRVPHRRDGSGEECTVDCVAASVVDRVLAVLVLLLLCVSLLCVVTVAAALGWEGGVVNRYALPTAGLWGILGAVVLTVAGLLVALNVRAVRRVGRMAGRLFSVRVTLALARLWWAMRSYAGRRSLMVVCGVLSAAVITTRLLVSWAVVHALGIDVHVAALVVVLPLAWAVLMLPISIGGLGLQEGTYVLGLAQVGVPAAAALAMSLIEQVIARISTLPGAAYWLFEPRLHGAELHQHQAASLEPVRR